MKSIDTLFDRMDAWRHLPSYQLERRADLFFSLYLPEVLEATLGFPVAGQLVPEFPVRIGTIRPGVPNNQSDKIDYVALSADARRAILVELKTDGLSRRESQDQSLRASREVGFAALLGGVLDIFRASQSKRKYFALLTLLESMGLLRIPGEVKEIMARPRRRGLTAASRRIEVTTSVTETIVRYVQPHRDGDNTISFEDFRAVVETHDDPVSQRFARSLGRWAAVQAGEGGASNEANGGDGHPPR
jgi:hypothetical protein